MIVVDASVATKWFLNEVDSERARDFLRRHPLADCVYLTLVLDLGRELATCDAKFHAKDSSSFPQVRPLADFG